ncbi:hypothetical protein CerSpe_092770 [Prunus speciosa]|uniref:Transcription elongation factor n=1 Tax=Prunus avium TaxID=42229 RepID=A0A6P5TLN5_PRUAV|nr:transcription elongation factor TFIIS [Prunus avium]
METELLELFEAVKKSADAATSCDGGAEESQCLDALEQLKNFPVTYQLLISTQVGKRLRHLTKHPRKKIQTFSSALIDTWKGIVIKEANKDAKNGNLERIDSLKRASPSAESPRAEKVQKTSAVKVEKVSKAEPVEIKKVDRGVKPSSEKAYSSETVKTERKVQNANAVKTEKAASAESVKVEKIAKEVKKPALNSSAPPKLTSMIKSNDTARDRVRGMLHEALSKVSQEADERFADYVNASDPIRVAVTVESVLFEHWGGSTGAQKAKYRSLIFNLKDQKNPDFRRKVLLGDIEAERLVDMSTAEMASDQRQEENKKLEQKALFECERGGPPKATTDQFKCGRCGHRKTTYYQMQTRSADEPMTTYVTCVNCNNRWKFC